jgi:hypothetical protein
MAEYAGHEPIYKDVSSLAVVCYKGGDERFDDGVQYALELLDAIPTADVVEVVRCRDCVYMMKLWGKVLCAKKVYSDDYSVKVLTPTNLDNFCNYGARMDGKVLPHKFIGKSQDGECGVEILDGKDGEGK